MIMIWDPRSPHSATPALETHAVSCDAGTGAALAHPSLAVTALAWTGASAAASTLLLAGSEDGTLSWFDLRAPAAALGAHKLHADAIRSISVRAHASAAVECAASATESTIAIATASDDQCARVSRLDAAAQSLTVELRIAHQSVSRYRLPFSSNFCMESVYLRPLYFLPTRLIYLNQLPCLLISRFTNPRPCVQLVL